MKICVILSFLAFLSSILLSLLVWFKAKEKQKRAAFIYIASMAGIWCLFPFVSFIFEGNKENLFFLRLIYMAGVFTGPAFLNFTLTVIDARNSPKERLINRCCFLAACLLIPFAFTNLFIKEAAKNAAYYSLKPGDLFLPFITFFFLLCSYAFFKLFYTFIKSVGLKRNQYKYIFFAYFLAFLSALMHFGTIYGHSEIFPHDTLVIACMGVLTYTLIKFRLVDIRLAISNTVIFIIVYAFVLGVPFFYGYKRHQWEIAIWAMLVFATVGPIIFHFLRRQAENKILEDVNRIRALLRAAFKGMTSIRELGKLLDMIVKVLSTSLESDLAIYLFDTDRGKYILRASDKNIETAITVEETNPLIRRLKNEKIFSYGDIKFNTGNLKNGETIATENILMELEKLSAELVLPLKVESNLLGFIAVGKTQKKKVLSPDLIDDLFLIGDQASLAIENAMYYEANRKQIEDESKRSRLESLDMLVSTMAHEIDNPIGIVMGGSDGIQEIIKGVILKLFFEHGCYPNGQEILEGLIKHDVIEEVSEEGKKIAKYRISEVGERGMEILYDLIRDGVVEDVNPTDVEVKSNLDQKENLVRKAARDDFEKVWAVLKARTEVRLRPNLDAKETLVREITKNHFDKVWKKLKESKKVIEGISPDLREKLYELCAWVNDGTVRVSAIVKSVEMYSKRQNAPLGEVFINLMMLPMDAMLALNKKKYGPKVALVKEIQDDLPPVWGQAIFIEEIITNLVKNGFMAASEEYHEALGGKVILKIYRKKENSAIDNIVIDVSDNGVGIKEKILKQVFQVPTSQRGSAQGQGVGLYHVRRMLDTMRGTVEAKSEGPHKGARFIITLPVYKGGNAKPKKESKVLF